MRQRGGCGRLLPPESHWGSNPRPPTLAVDYYDPGGSPSWGHSLIVISFLGVLFCIVYIVLTLL